MLAKQNFAAWVFSEHADKAHKTAIVSQYGSLTYSQLEYHSRHFASYLNEKKYTPQQRIIINIDDSVGWPVAFFGTLLVGLNPVLVGHSMLNESIQQVIDTSDAVAIITNNKHKFSCETIPSLDIMKANKDYAGHYAYHPDEICFWTLSSGSTGQSKCIVNRHSNLYNLNRQLTDSFGISSNSIILSTAKMSWAYGFNNTITLGLGNGCTTHVLNELPNPTKVFNRVIQHSVSHLFTTPSVIKSLTKHGKNRKLDNVKVITSGEPLPLSVETQFMDMFKVPVYNTLGMSEVTQNYCVQTPLNYETGTLGTPALGVECELRDSNGVVVGNNVPGEMYVRTACQAVMYWKDLDKTRSTFLGDWVRTGDVCVKNDNGNFIYIGRNDDLIKIKGLFVSPIEVESAILNIQGVDDCVVYHTSYECLNELCALIIADNITDSAIRETLSKVLPAYKIPKHIKFTDEIKKTITGKKIRSFKVIQKA